MLRFVMLKTEDIHKTAMAYEILGLTFVKEFHGDGPVHLAAESDTLVLEIYPGSNSDCSGVMFGFEVENLDTCHTQFIDAAIPIVKPVDTMAGTKRFIACDPDGRQLFVSEA